MFRSNKKISLKSMLHHLTHIRLASTCAKSEKLYYIQWLGWNTWKPIILSFFGHFIFSSFRLFVVKTNFFFQKPGCHLIRHMITKLHMKNQRNWYTAVRQEYLKTCHFELCSAFLVYFNCVLVKQKNFYKKHAPSSHPPYDQQAAPV